MMSQNDFVFICDSFYGIQVEFSFVGVMSFMCWCFSCDFDGVDFVIIGVLFDLVVLYWFGMWFGLCGL